MTLTESQKREALEAVDDLTDGSKHDWRKFAHTIAHFLRLAESELTVARRDAVKWESLAHSNQVEAGAHLAELSALRAENDSLKEKLAGITEKSDELYRQWLALDRHGDNSFGTWRARAEAAEAKVARLAEALKQINLGRHGVLDATEMALVAWSALRETEGGANP